MSWTAPDNQHPEIMPTRSADRYWTKNLDTKPSVEISAKTARTLRTAREGTKTRMRAGSLDPPRLLNA